MKTAKVTQKIMPVALNTSDAARYLGASEAMMRKMRADGSGPPYKRIGRKIVYLRKDLKSWIENQD